MGPAVCKVSSQMCVEHRKQLTLAQLVYSAVKKLCCVCVDRLHHARDNQDQQRLDQEEENNGEAKNDDMKPTDSEIAEEAEAITAEKKNASP
ncbi:hypothetical protein DAPPUDRAFT_276879, partial [Daphnia pulex]